MRYLLASALASVLMVNSASAAFSIWLSDKAPGESPTPAAFAKTGVAANSTGSLYLYGDGDSQLSGLSLDLLESGGGIKLTSATVNNPGGRWSFLDGPLTIADSLITNIGGAAIPPGAPGVGGSVADEVPGAGFLLATIGYQAIGAADALSTLTLRVGSNLIADYDGNGAQVSLGFGNPNVDGATQGLTGIAGTVKIAGGGGTVPTVGDLNLVTSTLNQVIGGTVAPLTNVTGLAFDNINAPVFTPLIAGKTLELVNLPTLDNAGNFSWNTAGAKRGTYAWAITGTGGSPVGTDAGIISVQVTQIPEPATLAMVGLALVGFVGAARRRS